jgi:hypothetical protein
MSIDDVTTQLRSQLQEAFGVDGAAYLMDRPPGGWRDLVTNETLRLELRALRAELKSDIADLRADHGAQIAGLRTDITISVHELQASMEREFRAQTWRLMTATLSAIAVLVAAIGIFVSLAKL